MSPRELQAKSWRAVVIFSQRSNLLSIAVALDHLAPALADLGPLLLGELILVRFVSLDAGQVRLQPRQECIKASQVEMLVNLSHLIDRVLDEVLIAQFVKSVRLQQFLAL